MKKTNQTPPKPNKLEKPISKLSLYSLIGASGGSALLLAVVFLAEVATALSLNGLLSFFYLLMGLILLVSFFSICFNGLFGQIRLFPLNKDNAPKSIVWLAQIHFLVKIVLALLGAGLIIIFHSLAILSLIGWACILFLVFSLLLPLSVAYWQQIPITPGRKETKYSVLLHALILESADWNVVGKIKEAKNFKKLLQASSKTSEKEKISLLALSSLQENKNLPALLLLEELYPDVSAPKHINAEAAIKFWQKQLTSN